MKYRKKRLSTRKRRALRRVLILLILVIASWALGSYGYLPSDNLREMEEMQGVGRTEVLRRIWSPATDGWNRMVYLSANENAVMLSGCFWNPFEGWTGSTYSVIDCSKEEKPVHSLVHFEARDGKNGKRVTNAPLRTYGRVDDPAVEVIEVRVGIKETGKESREVAVQRSERKDWIELNGRAYFLMQTDRLEWEGPIFFEPMLRALDADGNVVAEYMAPDWIWSVVG